MKRHSYEWKLSNDSHKAFDVDFYTISAYSIKRNIDLDTKGMGKERDIQKSAEKN